MRASLSQVSGTVGRSSRSVLTWGCRWLNRGRSEVWAAEGLQRGYVRSSGQVDAKGSHNDQHGNITSNRPTHKSLVTLKLPGNGRFNASGAVCKVWVHKQLATLLKDRYVKWTQ